MLVSLDFFASGRDASFEVVRAGGWKVLRFLGEDWASLASAGAPGIKPGGGLFTGIVWHGDC